MPFMWAKLEGTLWVVKGILTEEQERDGFQIVEDEHLVYVKRFDEVCLALSSSGATRESIQEAVESIRVAEAARL